MSEELHHADIEAFAQSIESKAEFRKFLEMLTDDLKKNSSEWENPTLPRFLEAMSAWIESAEYYYQNHHIDHSRLNPWRIFADALLAARVFE